MSRDFKGQEVDRAAARARKVIVFDSGLGGLTVFQPIAKARRDAELIYVADDEAFPYGALSDDALVARVEAVMADLVHRFAPDLIVIACNTASTLVLARLRARHSGIQFVGTVPAIKPAALLSRSGLVSVLATPATVKRDYTRALIRDHAPHVETTLVGAPRLAGLAEARLRGDPIEDQAIEAEIAPAFVSDGGRRTDQVVLACTHFPLLLDAFERLAPWPVTFVDPAPAIARRVGDLLGPHGRVLPRRRPIALFTSGRRPPPALAAALKTFGLAPAPLHGARSRA